MYEGRLNFKFGYKHDVCTMWIQKTLLQKHDKNKTISWQRYVHKISVKQIESNVGFYFYLYPLSI
jgi:hypothetical protein